MLIRRPLDRRALGCAAIVDGVPLCLAAWPFVSGLERTGIWRPVLLAYAGLVALGVVAFLLCLAYGVARREFGFDWDTRRVVAIAHWGREELKFGNLTGISLHEAVTPPKDAAAEALHSWRVCLHYRRDDGGDEEMEELVETTSAADAAAGYASVAPLALGLAQALKVPCRGYRTSPPGLGG